MEENPYQSPELPAVKLPQGGKYLVPSFTSTWDVCLLFSCGSAIPFAMLGFIVGRICYPLAPGYFNDLTRPGLRAGPEYSDISAFLTASRFAAVAGLGAFALGLAVPWIMCFYARTTRWRVRSERQKSLSNQLNDSAP